MGNFFDKRKRWDEVMTRFELNAGEIAALVGYPETSGVHRKSGTGQPITLPELAAVHEYGSHDGHIPERSFIRSAMAEHEKELEKLTKKVANAVSDGRMEKKRAIGILAQKAVDWIRGKIDEGVPPPNRPSTVAAKGSDHTLIDTGQLRNSLTWSLKEKK